MCIRILCGKHWSPNSLVVLEWWWKWNTGEKRRVFGLGNSLPPPPLLGKFISRIEYQTIFLTVLKKEQEVYFKKQIEMLENGLELSYADPLACASPYIDQKTKLLKSKGRIGYNMKSKRNIEFIQEHSEHYQIILPSRGSFVKSYL